MASKPFGKTLRTPLIVTEATVAGTRAYWPDAIEANPRSSCFWIAANSTRTGAVPSSAMNINRCQSMSHLPMFMNTPTVIGWFSGVPGRNVTAKMNSFQPMMNA